MLRDKKVLINPTRKADEQIVNKISSIGAPIKESEGSIIIDDLDQSNVEKISWVLMLIIMKLGLAHRVFRTSNEQGAMQIH